MIEDDQIFIVGCGNPLLDIIIQIDQNFWKKYGLVAGGFTFQEKQQESIYDEAEKHPTVSYLAGGSTLNTLRVCQALMKIPNHIFYTGCIGNDSDGNRIKELIESMGIKAYLAQSNKNPTGKCCVSIVDNERSLCTLLGAANDYTKNTFQDEIFLNAFNSASIVYSSGFFVTVCYEGIFGLAKLCQTSNKIFCTNLSAESIIKNYQTELDNLLFYTDIVFGNNNEFIEYAKLHSLDVIENQDSKQILDENATLINIGKTIANLPKCSSNKPRIVVITCGINSTILICPFNSKIVHKAVLYPIIPVSKTNLIDTNGAGDAFVGGFLYGIFHFLKYLKKPSQTFNLHTLDYDVCVHYAHIAANQVVQNHGCSFNFSSIDLTYRSLYL